ncbi:uncharacterized protein Z519_09735 [Cladophialophora bantiana CBS 173.52]|uniref:F-box domain-containing protein n=1 Tax=Cladophialophora bantiana (strain ATCC 10958 / CBS 173.52 / CDC B-1940 / NIH 8579) TaxID=1442370 RepID=A0A0D2HYD9_CLAB1|nr:uncharacterized protein Z519_09735 [Cladophialophora bantiana CBS 173.52]KIW89579.1 hypothetical protein Z519_09735 [Cladophialophora bantiana CBS 173.52]
MDSVTAPPTTQHSQDSLINIDHVKYAENNEGGPSSMPHIPDEILLEVLKYHIPKNGVTIFPSSYGDVCPATLTSLLRTSHKVRNEILHYTKHFPLRIYIASGKHCQCNTLKNPHNILATYLGKAAQLPLTIWNEVIVTFQPELHESVNDACEKLQRTLTRTGIDYSTFNTRTKWRKSISCVRRQTAALTQTMEDLANLREDDQVRLRFVFDGLRGLDAQDQRRRTSVWEFSHVENILDSWRWQAQLQGTMLSVNSRSCSNLATRSSRPGGGCRTTPTRQYPGNPGTAVQASI